MKVGFLVRFYAVGLIVSSFAVAAPAAVMLQGVHGKCFGYPMAVPSGEKDVVVTLADCLADSEDGGVELVTTDRSSAFSIGKEVSARLAVVRFPSGSVAKAAAPDKASGLVPMAASPLITREGELLGLTAACDAIAGGCEVASVTSREARAFLSKVTESVWGADEAAVQGEEHQTCRLFGGFRRHGGFGGGFRGFVYAPAVRVSYVRVHVVQYVHVVHVAPPPQVVHVHHHHYHAAPPCQPACQPVCTQPSYHQPSCPQHQHPHQPAPPEDDDVSPAPPPENPPQAYVPPPPPPLPAYVGYYVGGSESAKAELRHAVQREVAATGKKLIERRADAEMAIARNSPEDSIYDDHSRLYASVIKQSISRNDGQWIAKRAPRKTDGTLIAGSAIQPVPASQIEFLAYFR